MAPWRRTMAAEVAGSRHPNVLDADARPSTGTVVPPGDAVPSILDARDEGEGDGSPTRANRSWATGDREAADAGTATMIIGAGVALLIVLVGIAIAAVLVGGMRVFRA